MELEHHNDICTDKVIYTLSYDRFELENIRLGEFDRALIKECEESNSIADKLLALECIARRMEEQKNEKTNNNPK